MLHLKKDHFNKRDNDDDDDHSLLKACSALTPVVMVEARYDDDVTQWRHRTTKKVSLIIPRVS